MTTTIRDFNVPGGATIGSKNANQIRLLGSLTNNAVSVVAEGSDTDISIALIPKGAGVVNIASGTGLSFSGMTANAVVYLDSTKTITATSSFLFDGTNSTIGGTLTAAAFIPAGTTVPVNGIYLPGTNSVGIATDSTNRLTISSTGKVGIGQAATTYILETASDASINGIRIGLGGGSVSTNTVFGKNTLAANVSGTNSVAIGNNVLSSNVDGSSNTAIGNSVLTLNISGYSNTGIGSGTLQANLTGSSNIGIGSSVLSSNTSGNSNIGIGNSVLYQNISGTSNIGIGLSALYNNTANDNIAIGYNSLYSNDTGAHNLGIGYNALYSNTVASNNVAIGKSALSSTTTGNNNTALGYQAGYNSSVALTTGFNNTFIGYDASATVNDLTNSTALGNGARVTDSNQVVIGNTSVLTTLLNGNVLIDTTTNPHSSKLVVNGVIETLSGGIRFPDGTSLTSATSGMLTYFTTSSLSQVAIDTFSAASYRTAKYLIQMESSATHHVIELLLIHTDSTVYLSQYNEIFTGASLGVFDATIASGTVSLLFTPTNTVNALTILRQTIV